jgi:predicted Rossmann fold nucleotide-binding protein DprA/Smf involved in DNA uptake
MDLTARAQTLLLLTSALPGERTKVRPLTAHEWGRFAAWLRDHGAEPEQLLSGDLAALLGGWTDSRISLERLQALLDRGVALALALERWNRAGVWVITRADEDYPSRLKRKLRANAPPVLYGYGDQALLERGGLAVVGSRRASEQSLELAARLGRRAAETRMVLISGGARGADDAAASAALAAGGEAVVVLADGLLKAGSSAKYREPIMDGRLALVSPNQPEGIFSVATAMGRNKYVYCLADDAIVVASDKDRGGTWEGAIENLKHGWTPLRVPPDSSPDSALSALAAAGAQLLDEGSEAPFLVEDQVKTAPAVRERPVEAAIPTLTSDARPPMLYDVFLGHLRTLTTTASLDAKELAVQLELTETQLRTWLRRAKRDGLISSEGRPVKYRWTGGDAAQVPLFEPDP